MLTDEQREARRKGISATDVAAILGMNRWRSPLQVQAEKLGLDEGRSGDTIVTLAGHALEPLVAQQYVRDNDGVEVRQGDVVVAAEDARLRCTPDYWVHRAGEAHRLLEIKCVFSPQSAADWGAPETDEVPYPYLLQTQWQMGVTGMPEVDVARFFGGRVAYYRVRRDADLWGWVRDTCLAWWERHVERQEPVEPGPLDLDWLRRRAPPTSAPVAEATPEEASLLEDWREAWARAQQAEADAKAAEARVLAILGPREGLRSGDLKVTYRATKGRSTIDWPSVTKELNIDPEVLERHTKKSPGYRRPHCSWWRDHD